jgi:hypothetical protein
MAEEPHRALSRHGWLLLLVPVLALTVALTAGYLWNEDFWWYLSSGRVVLEHGGLPDVDPILYTSAPSGGEAPGGGTGWVYHSWLWTVLVAGLDALGGLGLVVLFHALVATTIVTLIYTSARVDRYGLVNALAAVLFLAAAGPRLCGKAELATWLMLVLFFLVLDRRERFTWKEGVGLAALQVLWANLHGGFPLGIFVALCYAAGGWAQERFHRGTESREAGADAHSPSRWPPLWYPAVLFAVSVADPRLFLERLRPFGLALDSPTSQPLGTSGTPLILEWRSPFSPNLDDPTARWLFFAALGLGLVGFARARLRSLPRLLFFAGLAVLAATAVRHNTLLALAAALVTVANLSDARAGRGAEAGAATRGKKRQRPRRDRRGALGRRAYPVACGVVGIGLLAAAGLLWIGRDGFDGGQPRGFFAVKPSLASPDAVRYVREQGLPGPIFNDYVLGAYLGAELYPDRQVFIDSRVLDPTLVESYTRMIGSATAWRDAETRYGFRTVILGHYSKSVRSALGVTLLRDPRWRLVYAGPLAVVFARSDRPAPRTIRELGPTGENGDGDGAPAPFAGGPEAERWVQRIFLRDFPTNYLVEYMANLGHLGLSRELERVADAALSSKPDHPLLLRQRCAARYVLRKTEGAVEDCSRAYEGRPEDPQIAWLYASVLVRDGERDRARSILDRALREDPGNRQLLALRRRLGG